MRTLEFTPERRMMLQISGKKGPETQNWDGRATSNEVQLTIKGK
jgi:hypothetical protein